MHLFFIFLNEDTKGSVVNYAKLGVRLGQIFYLISFFSLIGSLHELIVSSRICKWIFFFFYLKIIFKPRLKKIRIAPEFKALPYLKIARLITWTHLLLYVTYFNLMNTFLLLKLTKGFLITYGVIVYNSEFVSVLADNKSIVSAK